MSTLIFLSILMLMTIAKLIIQGFFLLHRLQQLGYYNLKFIKWLEGNQYRSILSWNIFELLVTLLVILILYFNIKQIPDYKFITSSIMLFTFSWKLVHPFISGWVGPRASVKVPLVFTARLKRLIASLALVTSISLLIVFYFTAIPLDTFTLSTWRFFQFNSALLFISVVTPFFVLAANFLNTPVEGLVHLFYFKKAQKKLKKINIKKIGITGSYGKTSSKFFLSTILKEKYNTILTPASYNTPMGISKVINDTKLEKYEIFVVEMGADKKGDIKKLCRLVKPDLGIITAIDIQHLETFETLDNIIKTKLSLFHNLSGDGFGIYNFDSKILQENILKENLKIPLYHYSINNNEKANITAKDIKHTREGLEFTAVLHSGEKISAKTELLGRHNISNLLSAILMASLLGMKKEEIESGISKIHPVEHRLQRIESPSGVLVLDDAFNANLNGALEALHVLKEIKGNKKIIVTPGLISLGEKEEETNKLFGKSISDNSDIAILVGPERTESIYDGLIENNYSENNIHVVNSLDDAKIALSNIIGHGDIVLFENDLPDIYNE